MTNALNEDDIQKIIQEINKVKIPPEKARLSASKMTDKNGCEKFVFTFGKMGNIILSPDADGIYHLEKLEGYGQEIVSITFHAMVKEYTGKDWPDQ